MSTESSSVSAGGVGVNLKPLLSNSFSSESNLRFDVLIIFGSIVWFVSDWFLIRPLVDGLFCSGLLLKNESV